MPIIRRTGVDMHTWTYQERMVQRPPKKWVDAGQLEGNPRDHESGWKGYLIDGRGKKIQISAEWVLNEYQENNLAVTLHNVIGNSYFVMYKTGKVTFRGQIQLFNVQDPEIPYLDDFSFTWTGNEKGLYKSARTRAFRIMRKVA